ncbi:hypothetical protein K504DRAFT_123426 [Pleomassaria siparia CBS 279.74]|uniref:Uncharacterized protein n=1 Tax=Pleomassaria siparia CBS 279.74 TaxID=1314801 RepID=A0A6G1KJT3_9PLEO|nr:hypothetical protein K504DRAFT_123426 [Pleomassaria siparia CBS 279.74]
MVADISMVVLNHASGSSPLSTSTTAVSLPLGPLVDAVTFSPFQLAYRYQPPLHFAHLLSSIASCHHICLLHSISKCPHHVGQSAQKNGISSPNFLPSHPSHVHHMGVSRNHPVRLQPEYTMVWPEIDPGDITPSIRIQYQEKWLQSYPRNRPLHHTCLSKI